MNDVSNGNGKENGNKMVAFLLGAAAGGIAALLFAPSSGADTRRRLGDGAGRARHAVGTKAHEVGDMARTRVRQVREGARHQVGAVRGAMSEGKEAYRRELGKGEQPRA